MSFHREIDKIVIMLHENVMLYPPALNLIECLLNCSYRVHLVSSGQEKMPAAIKDHALFSGTNIVGDKGGNAIRRARARFELNRQYRAQLITQVNDNDILWTLNPRIIRTLGHCLDRYSDRHVMELFELMGDFFPLFNGDKHIGFDLSRYARRAWKTVVPERNRAYIQKATWGLDRLPYVLPNKPYSYPVAEITDDMLPVIRALESEKRKIIMYLGVFTPDRTFKEFAEAIEAVKDEFCLCLFGNVADTYKDALDSFCKQYECVRYMGFFPPPKHLTFLKYARIALVPYFPGVSVNGTSAINALYCAPNKIWEYAGSRVPMVGTDVLGLREPFEKYGIGVCCDDLKAETIVEAIRYADTHHDDMVKGCRSFYHSVDIDEIVNRIINDK